MFVLHVCFYLRLADKITYTIFLDSTYMHEYTLFVLPFLPYFILYGSL